MDAGGGHRWGPVSLETTIRRIVLGSLSLWQSHLGLAANSTSATFGQGIVIEASDLESPSASFRGNPMIESRP